MGLQSGKLPHDHLRRLIRNAGKPDRQVLVGPMIGEDAAVIDLGEDLLILKTDPITYAISDIGWYTVHINANDIATMGARPRWFQACILLPEGTSESEISAIFRQIDRACTELGVAVTGGHTEINPWIDRPIVVGDMHGICPRTRLVRSDGAMIRDVIVLTKGAGIEGTALLAREKQDKLGGVFSRAFLRRAENYLQDPGISVVQEALLGADMGATAMHDPTEGGVAVGLYEMATASGKGVLIEQESVLVRDETRRICDHFGLDPMGLLGSGALLITLPGRKVDDYLDALSNLSIDASPIGRITKKSEGLKISSNGRKRILRFSQRDEVLRVL